MRKEKLGKWNSHFKHHFKATATDVADTAKNNLKGNVSLHKGFWDGEFLTLTSSS